MKINFYYEKNLSVFVSTTLTEWAKGGGKGGLGIPLQDPSVFI